MEFFFPSNHQNLIGHWIPNLVIFLYYRNPERIWRNYLILNLMSFHFTVSYNNCLFIFGGFNGITHKHYNDLVRYDPRKLFCSLSYLFGLIKSRSINNRKMQLVGSQTARYRSLCSKTSIMLRCWGSSFPIRWHKVHLRISKRPLFSNRSILCLYSFFLLLEIKSKDVNGQL